MNEQEQEQLVEELADAFDATGWDNDNAVALPVSVGDVVTFTGEWMTIESTIEENEEVKDICYNAALTDDSKQVSFTRIAFVGNGLPLQSTKRKERVIEFFVGLRKGIIPNTYIVVDVVERTLSNGGVQKFLVFAKN